MKVGVPEKVPVKKTTISQPVTHLNWLKFDRIPFDSIPHHYLVKKSDKINK